MTILLGDTNEGTTSKLVHIFDIEGYNIECADKTDKANGKVYVTPKNLFTKHKIHFDYNNAKHTPYQNNRHPKLVDDHDSTSPSPSPSLPHKRKAATKATRTTSERKNKADPLEPDVELEIKIFTITQLDPEAGTIAQDIKNLAIAAQDDTWDCDEAEATYKAYSTWIAEYHAGKASKAALLTTFQTLQATIDAKAIQYTRETLRQFLEYHLPPGTLPAPTSQHIEDQTSKTENPAEAGNELYH
ncbi:hypothetical protein N7449_005269 [Penicillium cf. viridicatum]|uniref:Uncharacterized protein n=1 Tax=Penicillium cf. viridicatum TaxID=2972119 RepID=A0A9W9MKV3_9EURO|nr:hypothetical protein N7449_005269 [Penicillium cf. viridicatum]